VKHWGAWALIRRYELVLANLPGGGLVPSRWGCTMPRVIVWALEVPSGQHPLVDMDSSLTFASPVAHTITLGMVQPHLRGTSSPLGGFSSIS